MEKAILSKGRLQLSKLFIEFLRSERAGGVVLILCTVVSLVLANSSLKDSYGNLWHHPVAGSSIAHWINDGLMSVFFLMIGLELEREIYSGELSEWRKAILPAMAAIGGMIVPAGLYMILNPTVLSGAGIPMATDIAFAVGILSLLGRRVPTSLVVFLTALAVIDDLGAILVIAIFYTDSISWVDLLLTGGIFVVLMIMNRLKVTWLSLYLIGGLLMWYFMVRSGVHATLSGVLLAFTIPFGNGSTETPSYRLQHFLHRPVAFIILPLFALANTCITLSPEWYAGLTDSLSLGIVAGLTFGKPLGIFLFTFATVVLGLGSLPKNIGWKQVIGVGFLGGIGFTMSIFITLLAFQDELHVDEAKIAILAASLASALLGYFLLLSTGREKTG
jgi:Na+:H+ antiporter, NhaA family